jgi:hypothetical protein
MMLNKQNIVLRVILIDSTVLYLCIIKHLGWLIGHIFIQIWEQYTVVSIKLLRVFIVKLIPFLILLIQDKINLIVIFLDLY